MGTEKLSAMRKGPRHPPEQNLEAVISKSQPWHLWLGMTMETNSQGCPSFQLCLRSQGLSTTGAQLQARLWLGRTHRSPASVCWAKGWQLCKHFP